MRLMADAPMFSVGRAFFHGPGGSGNTFCMNEVAMPVYQKFCPGCCQAAAAQNSAARLIWGATFHYMAALTRQQTLTGRKPGRKAMDKLQRLWNHLALVMMDEASLVDPQMLAVLNANANWGRVETYR